MQIVTAAVIKKDGKYFVAKRKKGIRLEGKWEFPGGKVETGETPTHCLVRELSEEFGIVASVGELVCSSDHTYPWGSMRLLAYLVSHESGDFQIREHDEIRWVSSNDLAGLDFAEADLPIVKRLSGDLPTGEGGNY